MDTNIKTITTHSLRHLIDETEGTLIDLKSELERREEQAQHREVDHMGTHIKSAELSLKSLRDFIAYLADDLRSNKN